MALPRKALFAFNALVDHIKLSSEGDLSKIEAAYPQLYSQMSECFTWGVQRETVIDAKMCSFFLSNIKFDYKSVGGQAGNAAQQASALGMDCLLHTNFANEELTNLFQHKERIFLPSDSGFLPAEKFSSSQRSAHHFVFEEQSSRTRFIASYDPVPLHIEDNFARSIDAELPGMQQAFVGGIHLIKTPDRLRKFTDEILRWKGVNPSLQVFLELGEFQNEEVKQAAREIAFPAVDMVGLSDPELASFGCDLEELSEGAKAVLYHSPQEQRVLPKEKENPKAMQFARKAAAFLAKEGRFGKRQEIEASDGAFIENPKRLVGLGDCFSSAYFMGA